MNYVVAVADLFLARCHNEAILSPSDFATIAGWEKEEIPVDVIFRSINELCDQGVKFSSLSDFQSLVKQNFVEWLRVQSDRSDHSE